MLQWKYLLRPLTKRLSKELLYSLIYVIVPILLPLAAKLRKVAGRFGARLLPICDYSHLGLSDDLNKEWSILDTFDMYSPKYDKPQTKNTVLKWFEDARGFKNLENGLKKVGFNEKEINGILGNNWFNFYKGIN